MDAFGPAFIIFLIQTLTLVACLWMTVMITIHIEDLYQTVSALISTAFLVVVGFFLAGHDLLLCA